jgi:hypothetical protein
LLSELSKGFNFAGISDLQLLGDQSRVETRLHQSTIYEDNTGCLELANNPEQFRPRTKHIGIKWHHFRGTVKNGSVVVEKIDTNLQLADPLTNPLPQPKFELLRKLLLKAWIDSEGREASHTSWRDNNRHLVVPRSGPTSLIDQDCQGQLLPGRSVTV